ncbi:MAG: AgmX/PglI C-terminal domain-containing protein [Deltaproteobacteria bacterium]
MKPALAASITVVMGCAGTPGKAATPAGPPPGEAPPATNTEATAPPQPFAPGTAPVVPEKGGPTGSLGPAPLPIVLASNPTPNAPAVVTAAAPVEKVGAPLMKRGTVEVNGSGFDVASVTRALNKSTASFLLCYQNSATQNPNIAGTTTLTFKVDHDGKVSDADTSGGLDREVEHCLVGVVTGIAFPKGRDATANAKVNYPLTFSMK